MVAYWLVVDHPYSAVTDEHGEFAIENIPVGEHIFVFWHEGCGYLERKLTINIEAGENPQKVMKYKASQILED